MVAPALLIEYGILRGVMVVVVVTVLDGMRFLGDTDE